MLASAESSVVNTLFDPEVMLWIVGGVIAIVAILAGTITSVMKVRAREHTKREIAAYVAEGSVDPEDAVKMLKAGAKHEDDEE